MPLILPMKNAHNDSSQALPETCSAAPPREEDGVADLRITTAMMLLVMVPMAKLMVK